MIFLTVGIIMFLVFTFSLLKISKNEPVSPDKKKELKDE
jgi:hypothetical protein